VSGVKDFDRFEAFFRHTVAVQSDATVKLRMNAEETEEAGHVLVTDRRDYTKIRAPALAIFAKSFLGVRHGDPAQRAKNFAWEQKYFVPFRVASIEPIRRELPGAQVEIVPGSHVDSVATSQAKVVELMQRFLATPSPPRLVQPWA
jgi:hypothetical protein